MLILAYKVNVYTLENQMRKEKQQHPVLQASLRFSFL